MSREITLTIPGEPQGKLRPRWSQVGTYTPKKTVNYETYIKGLFALKYPNFELMEKALKMGLVSFLLIPASVSKKKKVLMEKNETRPTKRPDNDNIIKTVCDALEGLAYKNDSQIVTTHAYKFYSNTPRLEIRISEW